MAAEITPQDDERLVSFVVPRQLVKKVKTALEKAKKEDSSRRIRICGDTVFQSVDCSDRYLIPSTFNYAVDIETASLLLRNEGLQDSIDMVSEHGTASAKTQPASAMELAVRDWYNRTHRDESVQVGVDRFAANLPKTYSIYGPMLLLPAHMFQSESWKTWIDCANPGQKRELFETISKYLNVSHIAINAPIPLHVTDNEVSGGDDPNILRSPTNLCPLYGDFGPLCSSEYPTTKDFSTAFWCHTKQNGITQIWAPRYTMFSRGNITEKTRVLKMPSVAHAIAHIPEVGCSAVDLYTGIGYFTFSYIAAGVSKVLGWDLNPWSIEGLRRGAAANKWQAAIHGAEARTEDVAIGEPTRLIAFVESNERALARIQEMRARLPPIRHVNCGLLPTSKASYATAAAALDDGLGGWIHVHENIAAVDIESKAAEVRQSFQELVEVLERSRDRTSSVGLSTRVVTVDHVQRVKSYAPGVFHCVIDLHVTGFTSE